MRLKWRAKRKLSVPECDLIVMQDTPRKSASKKTVPKKLSVPNGELIVIHDIPKKVASAWKKVNTGRIRGEKEVSVRKKLFIRLGLPLLFVSSLLVIFKVTEYVTLNKLLAASPYTVKDVFCANYTTKTTFDVTVTALVQEKDKEDMYKVLFDEEDTHNIKIEKSMTKAELAEIMHPKVSSVVDAETSADASADANADASAEVSSDSDVAIEVGSVSKITSDVYNLEYIVKAQKQPFNGNLAIYDMTAVRLSCLGEDTYKVGDVMHYADVLVAYANTKHFDSDKAKTDLKSEVVAIAPKELSGPTEREMKPIQSVLNEDVKGNKLAPPKSLLQCILDLINKSK